MRDNECHKIPHAMTCYGAVFDSDGLVTTLYMADSAYTSPKDKLETYTYDPKEYCFRTQVKNSDGSVSSAVFSIDYIDALWYDKDAVTGLALIPEPSAFGSARRTRRAGLRRLPPQKHEETVSQCAEHS